MGIFQQCLHFGSLCLVSYSRSSACPWGSWRCSDKSRAHQLHLWRFSFHSSNWRMWRTGRIYTGKDFQIKSDFRFIFHVSRFLITSWHPLYLIQTLCLVPLVKCSYMSGPSSDMVFLRNMVILGTLCTQCFTPSRYLQLMEWRLLSNQTFVQTRIQQVPISIFSQGISD